MWLFGLVLGCDNEWREKQVLVLGEAKRRRLESETAYCWAFLAHIIFCASCLSNLRSHLLIAPLLCLESLVFLFFRIRHST